MFTRWFAVVVAGLLLGFVGVYVFVDPPPAQTLALSMKAIDSFALEPDVTYPGGELDAINFTGDEFEKCARWCKAKVGCVGFVLSAKGALGEQSPKCWLRKSMAGPPVPDRCCVSARLK